jgi:hypothetical protein
MAYLRDFEWYPYNFVQFFFNFETIDKCDKI